MSATLFDQAPSGDTAPSKPVLSQDSSEAPSCDEASSAEGFLERMASAEAPGRESPLAERDQLIVEGARNAAADTLAQLEAIDETLRSMSESGNEAAEDFRDDHHRDLVERRRKAITGCYYDVTRALNEAYGTRFDAQQLFKDAWPPRPRKVIRDGQRLELLTEAKIEEAIEDATSEADLEGEGRKAVIDFFQGELSGWHDQTVGKSYIRLESFVYFDHIFPKSLDYNNRETVEALAGALWLFETGKTDPPTSVLSGLRGGYSNEVPQNEDIIPHPSFEKVKNIVIHKNGTVKIRFVASKHTRAFAEMFGIS